MKKKTAAARAKKSRGPDRLLIQQLLAQYEPLVRKIAGGFKRKLPRNVLREDLIAAGMGGLWDAIRRNPDGPTASFEWYVRVRVRGAILDELRAQDWLPRRARARANEASGTDAYVPPPAVVRFDEISEWEQNRALTYASSSEAATAAKEQLEVVNIAIALLPPRELHVLERHYVHGVKFKDIAIEMGVTGPRIAQLHTRAIERVRAAVAGAAPASRRDI